jgi:tripartite-type tricarboxylate transporter receptor subunit TctC
MKAAISGANMRQEAKTVTRALAAATLALACSGAHAQPFPAKPIRVVSATNVGTHGDTALRVALPILHSTLGQPVIIEARLGAGGQIAGRTVKEAEPDGHTLLLNGSAFILYSPHFVKDWPFDSLRDFTPVAKVSYSPSIVTVSTALPASTFAQFVEHVKRTPGKIVFGSTGVGTAFHLLGEQLNAELGIRMRHVPYKRSADAVNDLAANRIQVWFPSLTSISGALQAGQVRLLAVVGPERLRAIPDVPAIKEVAPHHRQLPTFFGLFGPARMPPPVVDRLNKALNAALRHPDVVSRMDPLGAIPGGPDAQHFADEVREGYEAVAAIVATLGIGPK